MNFYCAILTYNHFEFIEDALNEILKTEIKPIVVLQEKNYKSYCPASIIETLVNNYKNNIRFLILEESSDKDLSKIYNNIVNTLSIGHDDYLAIIDADQVYKSKDLENAIEYIKNNQCLDITYAHQIKYYYDDKHYFTYERCVKPLFARHNTKYINHNPVHLDKEHLSPCFRDFDYDKEISEHNLIPKDKCICHHFSMVRKDIELKLKTYIHLPDSEITDEFIKRHVLNYNAFVPGSSEYTEVLLDEFGNKPDEIFSNKHISLLPHSLITLNTFKQYPEIKPEFKFKFLFSFKNTEILNDEDVQNQIIEIISKLANDLKLNYEISKS